MKVLRGATLIDGTGSAPVPNAVVIINGERIEAVGRRGTVAEPPGAEVVDLSGMTLLPGLIDCHDHLGHGGYDLVTRWGLDAPHSVHVLKTAAILKQTLEIGYTAVRDGGGLDRGFKQAIEEGLIPGPRLVLGVSIISPTGGIGDRVSPSGHCQPAPTNLNLPSGVADGVAAVRAKVREMDRAGADVIKFATTGGASSRPGHGPKNVEFGRDEIQALVNEAHALGKRAMCHALGGPGLRLALEAGADTIEHGTYLDEDPDFIPMMAEKGIFFVPTFTVYVYHREKGAPHMRPRARDLHPHHVDSLKRALAAGVRIGAGTDAGGYVHGNNAQELQCMVEAGATPMQAIRAATGWAAECIGMEKELGTISRSKLADLVVVDGDPLREIRVLQDKERIRLVMKGGATFVDRLAATLVKAAVK